MEGDGNVAFLPQSPDVDYRKRTKKTRKEFFLKRTLFIFDVK